MLSLYKWGISVDQTVVCWDSGNDISLFQGEERGIIVGNDQPELLQWYYNNKTPFYYLAKDHYGARILEGLTHFSFIQ
ncbi:HAD family hydrolase [Crocosphaera sp. XPORK-15E]|uniref:HAD family hydrolase n=1 Tax=Crocosphaera sp. XPORK-15E TaxID=3110247 RepID=UPI002B214A20|nr:HAD family hydrolase [Crocosphaera sp. XPORK-15E]MEA5537275.1 HAD family hydrolase [Crocosphaera sp. XPORK-15E]